jgi:hypothetical protein
MTRFYLLLCAVMIQGVLRISAAEETGLVARADALRRGVTGEFTVLVEPPFVVLGDETPGEVKRRATGVVHWAVALLKKDFFPRDPDAIIEIWLFRDRASYERNLKTRWGEGPLSPYGFYSPRHHALFMNIATGGGTLVHEIVHPFLRANFPGCPPWFDEGLASLFEQSTERDGHIRGRVNWRLPGLQEVIRGWRLLSFRALTALDAVEFYGDTGGYNVHYGQSRYLCYYLQERGLLRQFYAELLASRDADPTGYEALQRVLGAPDMNAWQREWETFVLSLKFPE